MQKHWTQAGAMILALAFLPPMRAESPAPKKYLKLVQDQAASQVGALQKPDYPLEFRRRGYEAHMGLRIFVAENGRIDQVEVTDFDGDRIVVDYAMGFVRTHWRFRPFIVQGKPAAVTFVVPISFFLQNSKLERRSALPPIPDIMTSIFMERN